MKTLVFIPTYDERENVGPMVEALDRWAGDADLLFIDDHSPDGTGELLDELARTRPRLTICHRHGKLGVGGAHLDAIRYAYDRGYDTLVTLDCDFTHSPSDIPLLLRSAQHADIAVGSRYLDADSLPGWNLARKTLTHLGHTLTMHVLGIAQDATGGFRVYRLSTIPREVFDLVTARGYAFFFESLFIVKRNGLAVREVPIRLPTRTYGHSKMSAGEIARSVRQLVRLFVAGKVDPSRFRIARRVAIGDPSVVDTSHAWDAYWQSKSGKLAFAYEVVAAAYRNLVIKERLHTVIRREFAPGAALLHAGCGSGQVDVDLHEHAQITAVDISVPALERYLQENPGSAVRHASVFALPFPDAAFDGAYNLGVVEHFDTRELAKMFAELRRVVRPGGKVVLFWPHARASSVAVLKSVHWVMNDVLGKDVRLHPPEVSLLHSRAEARSVLGDHGFRLLSYAFGPRDMFVQAVVVAERTAS